MLFAPANKRRVDTYRFWGYEPYLIHHRLSGWWEFLYPILGSILIAVILITRLLQNFSWLWDGSGLLLNLMLLTILWWSTLGARRIRAEWYKFDKNLAQELDEERSKSGTTAVLTMK